MRCRVISMMPNWLIAQHLGLGPVLLEIVVQAVFQFAPMALEAQIDEVADDHAAQIAQPKLARNFVGGFHVGLERGGFGVGVLAEFAAVHVDRDDRFG